MMPTTTSCSRPSQCHGALPQQQQRPSRHRGSGRPRHGVVRAEAGDSLVPPAGPRRRKDWSLGPLYGQSREYTCEQLLEALQRNDEPYDDHGIEVAYRFADLDPFERSSYFGRSLDLGQFERFRRVFHTPSYRLLLRHAQRSVLSTLELTEDTWRQRVLIQGLGPKGFDPEERVYEVTLHRHCGGRFDGIWFTQSITVDGVDKNSLVV